MDQVACKGTWEVESEQLVKTDNVFVCTLRDKCWHYNLLRVPMIGKYDVVPISLNKEGLLNNCPEFLPTPFEKEERPNRGNPFDRPAGVV